MDWYKSPAGARKWSKKQIIDGTAGIFEGTIIDAIIWLVGDISFTSKGDREDAGRSGSHLLRAASTRGRPGAEDNE